MRPQCGPPTHLLLSDLLPCIFVCYLVHQLVGGYQIEMQLSFLWLDRQALLLPTSKGVGTPACLLLHHAPCLFPHLVLTCANNMFTMTSRCYLLIADILVAVVINLLHVWPPMWNPTFVFLADASNLTCSLYTAPTLIATGTCFFTAAFSSAIFSKE